MNAFIDLVLINVILFGLVHGLEPGHGWPFAFLYSIKQSNPRRQAFISSFIISICHFISSITVVVVYLLVAQIILIPGESFRLITAGILIILAIFFWREKTDNFIADQHEHLHENKDALEHEHEHIHLDGKQHVHSHTHAKTKTKSLLGLASFALLLGFVHEEELALIALFLTGRDPWLLVIAYGTSVCVGLIGITLICTKAYKSFLPKIQKHQDKIPKISAIILIVMALGFIFNII